MKRSQSPVIFLKRVHISLSPHLNESQKVILLASVWCGTQWGERWKQSVNYQFLYQQLTSILLGWNYRTSPRENVKTKISEGWQLLKWWSNFYLRGTWSGVSWLHPNSSTRGKLTLDSRMCLTPATAYEQSLLGVQCTAAQPGGKSLSGSTSAEYNQMLLDYCWSLSAAHWIVTLRGRHAH